jgi:hypothetical protein
LKVDSEKYKFEYTSSKAYEHAEEVGNSDTGSFWSRPFSG